MPSLDFKAAFVRCVFVFFFFRLLSTGQKKTNALKLQGKYASPVNLNCIRVHADFYLDVRLEVRING